MRIGLIVNPMAGEGIATNAEVARQAVIALSPQELLVGEGEMGADGLQDLPLAVQIHPVVRARGRERTLHLAERFARQGVDLLAVVGGDGTLADVALIVVRDGLDVPVLGIGVGSINAGSLITCQKSEVHRLATASLYQEKVDCLLAGCNGQLLGVGFNDCVLSHTVVATVDGQVVDVAVAEKIKGRNIPGQPGPVWTQNTVVRKKSAGGEKVVAQGDQVGTVVVGFAEDRFYAKAVAGPICLTSLLGLPAGCLVCSEPLVRTQADSWELIQREPVTSRYVSLDEGEQILVEALCPGTALCADGNPLKILSEGDVVEIGVKRRAVTAMRLGESANQRINESANQRIGNRQSPGARGSRPWPSWGDSRAMIHESFRRPSLACAGRRWR